MRMIGPPRETQQRIEESNGVTIVDVATKSF